MDLSPFIHNFIKKTLKDLSGDSYVIPTKHESWFCWKIVLN